MVEEQEDADGVLENKRKKLSPGTNGGKEKTRTWAEEEIMKRLALLVIGAALTGGSALASAQVLPQNVAYRDRDHDRNRDNHRDRDRDRRYDRDRDRDDRRYFDRDNDRRVYRDYDRRYDNYNRRWDGHRWMYWDGYRWVY
jgi:hypothetical protein